MENYSIRYPKKSLNGSNYNLTYIDLLLKYINYEIS